MNQLFSIHLVGRSARVFSTAQRLVLQHYRSLSHATHSSPQTGPTVKLS